MEKNEIIALVLIGVGLLLSFGFVFFVSLYKQRSAFQEFRKSFGEHKEEVILRKIEKLGIPVNYYKKPMTTLLLFMYHIVKVVLTFMLNHTFIPI